MSIRNSVVHCLRWGTCIRGAFAPLQCLYGVRHGSSWYLSLGVVISALTLIPGVVDAQGDASTRLESAVHAERLRQAHIPPSRGSSHDHAPRLTSSVTQLAMHDIAIGESGKRQLVLTNSALERDQSITLYSIWLSEPDAEVFSTDFVGPVELAGGESYSVEVRFNPTETGHRTGALYLSHSGESNLEIFTLEGSSEGQPAFEFRAAPDKSSINFGKSTLKNIGGIKPTSLQFGPDGRLYVADMLGAVKVYTVKRHSKNNYSVTATETIAAIQSIPNHNDDGKPNKNVNKRLVTGLVVVGTADEPIVYVASSDPRIGGGPSHTDTDLDTNSGMVSRLTRKGKGWNKHDLVRGLPRSEENHHGNGLAFDAARNVLYLAMGGNTNAGATSNNFAELPEYALSAAILEIDLGKIGNTTYDLPTLDDQDRPGTHDQNDPFGGNDGKNQARLVHGGPVQIYAPGFRNAYDIVFTNDRRMYTIDNGPNAGWGATPRKDGPDGQCSNAMNQPGKTYLDNLHHIGGRGYYGGHPNPTRANAANTFNAHNPQSPIHKANPVECDYRIPGKQDGALTTFGASTNGLDEYTASNFDSVMKGDLLAVAWDNKVYRLALNPSGDQLSKKTALFTNVGKTPLDVTTQADDQIFPGTIWVADFVQKSIIAFEPGDYAGSLQQICTGAIGHLDDDEDGFSNADEKANKTNPCSSADQPSDVDGDRLSDLTDTDDDNDGLPDDVDPFALDPHNGRMTDLPLAYTWENDEAAAGFLFNLGFSGLMSNGQSDYQSLFHSDGLTAGGAAGVLTIDAISAGDAVLGSNSQQYAFQFGVNARPDSKAFEVSTRINAPFAGRLPRGHESMGLYIGKGDQDNYIKLVMNGKGGTRGGLQFAAERNGKFQTVQQQGADLIGADAVDLMLHIDPNSRTVRAAYRIVENGQRGPRVALGKSTTLPDTWLRGETGLAVGIIATSLGGQPFSGTWDYMVIEEKPFDAASDPSSSGTQGKDTTEVSQNNGVKDATDDGQNSGVSGSGSGSDQAVTDSPNSSQSPTEPYAIAPSSQGLVAIEAEHAHSRKESKTHRWTTTTRVGASGGGSELAGPNKGALKHNQSDSPSLAYRVKFDTPGRYFVWVRGWGDSNANGRGSNDSVHVGINGTLDQAAALHRFPKGWHWSGVTRSGKSAVVDVPHAGEHTINVWMREDGFLLDKLVLAKGKYTPSGTGPAEVRVQVSDSDDSVKQPTSEDIIGVADSTSGPETAVDSDTGEHSSGSAGDHQGNSGNGVGNGHNASQGGTDVDGNPDRALRDINGVVSIEAASLQDEGRRGAHHWKTMSRQGSSGSSIRLASPNSGRLFRGHADSPAMSVPVDFSEAGTYQVWVRGWGDTAPNGEGKSDSVHVGLDGKLDSAAAIDRFPAGWHWSNHRRGGDGRAVLEVSTAGTHIVNVWMREDGFAIDKLMLVKRKDHVPTGKGPAETR